MKDVFKFLVFAAIFLFLSASAGAQELFTTVADAITGATSGSTLTVTVAQTFTTLDGYVIAGGSKYTAVIGANGQFSVTIPPTVGAAPFNAFYYADYTSAGARTREQWAVPVSTPSVNLAAVRVLWPQAPNILMPFAQVLPPAGCVFNQVPAWTSTGWACVNNLSATVFEVGGTPLISSATINFVAGANVTITNGTLGNITVSSSGGGTPGGSAKQFQFNNSGVFGGASLSFTPISSGLCALGGAACDNYQLASTSRSAVGAFISSDATAIQNSLLLDVGPIASGGSTISINSIFSSSAGVGSAVNAYNSNANSTGGTARGIVGSAGDDPADTGTGQVMYGGQFEISLTRASGSISTIEGVHVNLANFATGSVPGAETTTNAYGVHLTDMLAKGTTDTAALKIDAQTAGANAYAIEESGGKNVFGASTFTGLLTTVASATGGAGFNLPPGSAPTSPNNGDLWATAGGLFVRVGGVTQGPLVTIPVIYYQTIDANAAAQTQRPTLNLISGSNATVTCVDNAGATRTDCTIASSASAGSRWDQLSNPTANLSLAMSTNATLFTWGAATGAGVDMFKLTDTSSNTGTGAVLHVTTAASSSALPVEFDANGNGLKMTTAGLLTKVGTGSLDYASLSNFPSACGANNFATQIAATPGCAQPSFANLSGSIAIGQTVLTTLGDILSVNATPVLARVAGNTTTTKNFLVQTGNGTVSALPTWGTIVVGDLPTGIPNANLANSSVTINALTTTTGWGSVSLGGTLTPTWVITGADYVFTSTAANTPTWEQVNGGSSCGDATHAVSYSTTTHLFGCQALSASALTIQTNGVNNTTQTGLNFITSTVNSIGATITPSNPATTSEKFELTGTINATGGGTGLSNPTAHSLLVTEGSSVFNLVTSPTTNGFYACGFNVTASAAVDPTCSLQGVPVTQWTTGALTAAVNANLVVANGSGTITGPTLANNIVFSLYNAGSSTLTYAAASGSITGDVTVPQFAFAFAYTDNTSTWFLNVPTFNSFADTSAGGLAETFNTTTNKFGTIAVGSGTVTHTVGALTLGEYVVGNGSADVVAEPNRLNCAAFPGADASVQFQACLVALAAANSQAGIADGTGLGNTWSLNPFAASSLPASGELLLPPGDTVISVPVVIPDGWVVRGVGGKSVVGQYGSNLKASASWPANYSTGTITKGTAGASDVITGSGTTWNSTNTPVGCAFIGGVSPAITYGIISANGSTTSITLKWGTDNTGAGAGTAYLIHCPMVVMGGGGPANAGAQFGIQLKNVGVDCANLAAATCSVGILNWYAQEQSGASNFSVRNFNGVGLLLEGQAQNSGPWELGNFYEGASCSAGTLPVVVRSNAQSMYPIRDLSIGKGACATSPTVAVDAQTNNTEFQDLNFSSVVTGISIGANISCTWCATAPRITNGVRVTNAHNQSSSGTTLVHISNAFGTPDSTSLVNLAQTGITNILIDDANGCTTTNSRLGFYATSKAGGISYSTDNTAGCLAPAGGTVTSIATTSPITGGTITTTGTLACPTCVTSAASLTNNQLVGGAGGQGIQVVNLSGDVTTSGGLATTVVRINGLTVPASTGLIGTNGSSQLVAAWAHNVSAVLDCSAASGSGTAYTCTTSPSFTPADGDAILFEADVANTGAATLNVNSTSAAPIKKQGGGTALVANDFLAGQDTLLIFDGTNWQMQGQVGNASGTGTVTSFSAGNLSPLFTTSVATATTTPALTFSLSNAAAGTVLGNATGSAAGPTYTATPVLGVSGTAGTLAMFPSSGNFTTTLGSAATASNTVNFFATVPTNLHLFYCAVSTTVCTLTDAGYAYNSIPNADLTNSAITIAGTSVALGGSTTSFPSPGAIGGTTPAAGTFTTLTANTQINAGAAGTLAPIVMGNATSGLLTIEPTTGAITSYTIALPVAQPTAGNTFLSCTAASTAVCTWAAGGGGTPCTTTALSLQYDNTGAFGCLAEFTYASSTITVSAAGKIDLSAATGASAFRTQVLAGAAPALNGAFAYDSTNNMFVGGLNGAVSKFASFTITPGTNNNCVKWLVSGGNFLLGDAGSPCLGGISSVVSVTPVTASGAVSTDQQLMELSLPAGFLNTLKQPYWFNAAGVYSTAATQTPTLTFKIKLCTVSGCGSGTVVTLTSIATTATLASVTNNNWNLNILGATAATGTTGNLEAHGHLSVDLGATVATADSIFNDVTTAVSGNIDLTAALFVDFTVAESTGSATVTITERIGAVMPQSNPAGAAAASTSMALGSGSGTAGQLACATSSNTMGNCTALPPNNFLGVFLPGGTTYATTGVVSVVIDATQNVTFGDVLCASTVAGKSHDNGATACANGEWVGIVTTTASSVSTVTANLRLQ